ncbi:MAG: delta-60 repeat domain-containing protein [Rhodanobacteraceae bacterium]|nr:delta-60 repeat domain-containing protein [Rhodanobacteraceae bacterium]
MCLIPCRSALVGFSLYLLLSAVAFAQLDGGLDLTFGNPADPGRMAFAIVSRDPAETPGVLNWAQVTPFKVLPRSDGSAIVWSNAATPYDLPITTSSVPVAVRILANGTWDPSWGASGGGRTVIYVGEDYNWRANDAVAMPDGSMAVVGTIDNPDGSSDMAVWKFTAAGLVDAAFGLNGLRRLRRGGLPSDAGKTLHLADLDLLGNGSPETGLLIVGGNIRDGLLGPHQLGLVIMGPKGDLCPSFAESCGNVVAGDVGLPTEWRMLRIGSDLCPNGADVDVVDLTKFDAGVSEAIPVLLRGCGDTAVVKHTVIGNDSGTWRWRTNPTYANGSRSLVTFGPGFVVDGNAIVHAPVASLPLGSESLVIAGFRAQSDRSQPLLMAARLDRTSFSAVTYDADPPNDPWLSPGAYADTLAVQPDGKLILGGGTAFSSWTFGDALLMRLNPNLTPDASFGNLSASLPGRQTYGYTIDGVDRDNRVSAMALTPDGKLLVTGYSYASNDGNARYGSVLRILLEGDRIFASGLDGVW